MHGGTIFISYRRGADENAAGRLYEALASRIGGGRIFMDVDGIRPGTDFVDDLNTKLDECAAFLAVIGPGWVDRQKELGDEDDFIRLEYAAVLGRSNIPFIPIFFNNAQMPAEADLPGDLKGLVRRNAISMPHEHFSSVLHGRLLPELSKLLNEDLTDRAPSPAAAAHSSKWRLAGRGLAGVGPVGMAGRTRQPVASEVPEIAENPVPARLSERQFSAWAWGGAGLAAVGLLLFIVPILPNGSVISTLLGNPGEPALSVIGLYAEDRTECIDKIYSGEPFDSQAATKTVDGFSLRTGSALCGLQFRNRSRATIEVTLAADLIGRGIAGSSFLATPIVLAPNQSRELIFAQPPGVLSAAAQISEPGAPDRHWIIRLQ